MSLAPFPFLSLLLCACIDTLYVVEGVTLPVLLLRKIY